MQVGHIIRLYELDDKISMADFFRMVRSQWKVVELRGYHPRIDDYTAHVVDLELGVGTSVREMISWCNENTTNRWAYESLVCEERFLFLASDDALMFKIIWCGFE